MLDVGGGSIRLLSWNSVVTIVVPVIALIVAVLYGNFLILNYVHVMTGATWTGIDVFMGIVMTRVMRALEPPARVQMVNRLVPIMLFLMPTLASVTIASGIYLAQWEGILILRSGLIIASIALVLILSVQGFGMLLPNEVKIFLELKREKPNTEKIVRLGMRNFKLAGSQAIFQLVLIFLMANLRFGNMLIF